MIDEFKDILIKYFEVEGKIINRDTINILNYKEKGDCIIGILQISFLDFEYYRIIYNCEEDNFYLDVYQKIKECRITRNNEE